MNRNTFSMAIGVLFMAMGISVASAADADGPISGTGRAVIKRPPQLLRVQFVISADGKDVAEAIANLKTAQSDANKKLKDLAATESSIEFGPMQSPAVPDARQQYLQRMMAQQQGRKRPAPVTPNVSLSCTLKAEWPIKDEPQEQLLADGLGLQDKIKASGLGKSSRKMSAEDEEAMEEAAAMNGGAVNTNEPTFAYVAKVSEADRAAAMSEAFKKARADASLLAKAADSQLGALRRMSSSVSGPSAGSQSAQEIYMQAIMQQSGAAPPAEENSTDEATAAAPGLVALNVVVTASFDLAK